jgi:hypothetical protein
MLDLPLGCQECGRIHGHSTYCIRNPIPLFQSQNNRDDEPGREPVFSRLGCPECGKIVGHDIYCSENPIDSFQSEYDRGYEAGRRSAGAS